MAAPVPELLLQCRRNLAIVLNSWDSSLASISDVLGTTFATDLPLFLQPGRMATAGGGACKFAPMFRDALRVA